MLTHANPAAVSAAPPAQRREVQVFDDPTGRRERLLRNFLGHVTSALLALAVLLAHVLLASRWPDTGSSAADEARALADAVVLPLHADPGVNREWLARLRDQGRHAAFVVAGSEALRDAATLQALVATGHAVVAAPFSGRPGGELPALQRDVELAATQLALVAAVDGQASWALCGTGAPPAAERRAIRCAPLGMNGADLDALRRLPPAAATQALSQRLVERSAANSRATLPALQPAPALHRALGSTLRALLAGADTALYGATLLTTIVFVAFLVRFVVFSTLMLARVRRKVAAPAPAAEPPLPPVTVIVPAYNEEAVIAATVRSLLACDYPSPVQVLVVDDGSTDGTYAAAQSAFGAHPQVRVLTKPNGGKCSALNLGLAEARTEIVVCIDADTQLDPQALRLLCRHFGDARVGAVAGHPKVGNRRNLLTRVQALEYVVLNSVERQAAEGCNAITCVTGALGAYRRELLLRLGGYPLDTLAEDTDMTLCILRSGARIVYEENAIGWTEAPETLRDFMKQRFRWVYGTVQAATKHRRALFDPRLGSFGMLALPYLMLLQVGAGVFLLPLADAVGAAALWWRLGVGWMGWLLPQTQALFVALDRHQASLVTMAALLSLAGLAMAAIALRLDRRERLRRLLWLVPMQLCLRVLMGITAYRCIGRIATGRRLGWGRLVRTGHVALPADTVPHVPTPSWQPSLRGLAVGLLTAAVVWPVDRAEAAEVGLYVSDYRATPAGADDGYGHWRTLLADSGQPWREIRGAAALRRAAPAVVVLPQPERLTPAELRMLRRLQAGGTALLATGRLGPAAADVRAAAGSLLGVALRRLPSGEPSHVSVIGLTPPSAELPAGTRMFKLKEETWTPQPGRGTWLPAADFTDWSYRPITGRLPLTAVAYGTRGRARWVYFGFEAPHLQDGDRIRFSRLVQGTLAWLSAGNPGARLADWPTGYRSAQLVEMDTEIGGGDDARDLGRALDLAAIVASVGGHASYYCVVSHVARVPEVIDKLAAAGHEIGFHGDDHETFKGQPAALQAARFASMQEQLRQFRPYAGGGGFRAPYEAYDANTEAALADAGIEYHVADTNADPSRLPHFAPQLGARLVRLPRTQPDDENFTHEVHSRAEVQRLLRIDADEAARQGALALLSVHPDNFAPSAPVRQALPELLAHVTRPGSGVWLATGGEIARWWRERSRVTVQVLADRVRLEVTPGPPVRGLSIIVDADIHRRALQLQDASTARLEPARTWPAAGRPAWQSELRLRDVPAGVTVVRWSEP